MLRAPGVVPFTWMRTGPERNAADPGGGPAIRRPSRLAVPSPVTSVGAGLWLTPSLVDPAPRVWGSCAATLATVDGPEPS